MKQPIVVFWYRRDLRVEDNAGLYYALKAGLPVLPVFVFDRDILDDLTNKADKRLTFIHEALVKLKQVFVKAGSDLKVMYGRPTECHKELLETYDVKAIFTNTDYEPYAIKRDKQIADLAKSYGADFHSYKDQVVLDHTEVLKDNGQPYTVFTPYSRKWKDRLTPFFLKSYPSEQYLDRLLKGVSFTMPCIEEVGFVRAACDFPSDVLNESVAARYNETRDIPAIAGTTRLSVHLRFGTVSVRKIATQAKRLNETLLNELIWRDFYMMILAKFPHVVGNAFKPAYDRIQWRDDEADLKKWCAGQTGIPIVDAGMRELNTTGYMHNRVRMIVASFLTKNLLIDWRKGEAYFAEQLLDFDLSANNGGWQWASGSGCDAAPYFRVFNPLLQTQKFDPELKYVKKWVPEYGQLSYARPIVDLAASRDRCLTVYKAALGSAE